jgi:hypothetical protein
MSLGVKDEVGDQITQCIRELGSASAIEVAWWRFRHGFKLLCFGEVGHKLMAMEADGSLAFVDGRYEAVKQE